jgi:hypothetical protein
MRPGDETIFEGPLADRPALDPVAVEDDDLLGEAMEAFVLADEEHLEQREEITFRLDLLRESTEDEAAGEIDRIWSLIRSAYGDLLVRALRHGFTEGRKHPLDAGGSS